MTATEELRRLLDERGVEHYDGTNGTLWGKDASGYRFSADELTSGRMSVHMWCETPEQAVAATLGPGTCKVVSSTLHEYAGGYAGSEWEHELSCGHTVWWDSDAPEWCPWCGRKVVR